MPAFFRTAAGRAGAALLVVLLLLGGILLVRAPGPESPRSLEARQFEDFLTRLSSPSRAEALRAVLELPEHRELLSRPERLGQAAAVFSGERIRALTSQDALAAVRAFWRGVLLLGHPQGLGLMPPELARLRHQLVVAHAGRGDSLPSAGGLAKGGGPAPQSAEGLQSAGDGDLDPRTRKALEELVEHLFRLPAPPRDELGALLWDRANLEEMAGLHTEALESYRALDYEQVRDHWELESRTTYVLAKADLLGRIRGRFAPESLKSDPALDASLRADADPELGAFRTEEGGAMADLLSGIDLLHRGEMHDSAEAFSRYLRAGGAGGEGERPSILSVGSRPRQAAILLRALALLELARRTFHAADAVNTVSSPAGMTSRGPLELRLARILASLGLREEFETLAAVLGREDREVAALLEASAETVWGDRGRGAERLRERIAAWKSLPEASAWEELASGRPAATGRALFEAGQLCDELAEIPLLERIVGRLEFAVETETDEAYFAFLRALLRLRRGEVVEAWTDLERLLEIPAPPPGLSRRTVARVMEGAEEAADLLGRARGHLQRAEADLAGLRALRAEIDRTLALRGSMALAIARLAGESIDPARFEPRRESTSELLESVRAELASVAQPSYALERAWSGLQKVLARSFRDLARSRKLDAALARLLELEALLGHPGEGWFAGEEAAVLVERGMGRRGPGGSPEGATADFRRAGELYLKVAVQEDPSGGVGAAVEAAAIALAARAFEWGGDGEGVIRAVSRVETTSRDPDLLVRAARALLGRGDLERARSVLQRALAMGQEIERVVEEPGDPVQLGGYHFRDPPSELTDWLELYPYVDPENRTGPGRLRFDPARRTLQWRAPGEGKFGPPVFLTEGEMVRLASGDDPQKTILAAPRRPVQPGASLLPPVKGEWEVFIAHREAPVDPIQLEARLALAEADLRLARVPSFADPAAAVAFVGRHLGGDGSPRVRDALALLVERAVEGLFRDPRTAAGLKDELGRVVASWRLRVAEELADLAPGSEARRTWLRELAAALDGLAPAVGDAAKVREFLRRGIPETPERLRAFHVSIVRTLLAREESGAAVRATLEELERELFDGEARDELLFLCEQVGNRNPVWRRAMYLRAVQLERRADEAARAGGDPAVLGPPPDPESLRAEAREIYERLLAVASIADGPDWLGRAHLALARLEARAGRGAAARRWLDRLADADLESLGRDLLPHAREDLVDLARRAAFGRADQARRAGDLPEAARLFALALERHAGSPLVLWAHLQLGSIYEEQGLPEEAYREYQKGKALLKGPLASSRALEGWLGGGRVELMKDALEQAVPEAASPGAAALPAGGSARAQDREFWERIFDQKLKTVARGN